MDNLSEGLQSFQIPGGNFGFTGMQVDNITSLDQTLYSLVVDESGSVSPFQGDMEKAIKEVVVSLQRSPRADNLMYRHTHFSTTLREIHGFKPLQDCNIGDYSNLFQNYGITSLFDATMEAAEATKMYSDQLAAQHYMANGIVVVMTDGLDNNSTHGPNDIRKCFENMILGEELESLVTILIGVNIHEPYVKDQLDRFHQEAGFTQFIAVEDASERTMAKIANFVSQSVSSQSQALGTGGASQSLTF